MLMDENRMRNFKAAIDHVVFPGAKVLELGGGTGVLSWFSAAKASRDVAMPLNGRCWRLHNFLPVLPQCRRF
jgi:predicted RNA methylase